MDTITFASAQAGPPNTSDLNASDSGAAAKADKAPLGHMATATVCPVNSVPDDSWIRQEAKP